MGAFEDNMIRVFDKSRLVHSFEAHEQSVMSVCFTDNPYELFSCGQDGAVKLWDMRKHAEICSFKVIFISCRPTEASMMRLDTASATVVLELWHREELMALLRYSHLKHDFR